MKKMPLCLEVTTDPHLVTLEQLSEFARFDSLEITVETKKGKAIFRNMTLHPAMRLDGTNLRLVFVEHA